MGRPRLAQRPYSSEFAHRRNHHASVGQAQGPYSTTCAEQGMNRPHPIEPPFVLTDACRVHARTFPAVKTQRYLQQSRFHQFRDTALSMQARPDDAPTSASYTLPHLNHLHLPPISDSRSRSQPYLPPMRSEFVTGTLANESTPMASASLSLTMQNNIGIPISSQASSHLVQSQSGAMRYQPTSAINLSTT